MENDLYSFIEFTRVREATLIIAMSFLQGSRSWDKT